MKPLARLLTPSPLTVVVFLLLTALQLLYWNDLLAYTGPLLDTHGFIYGRDTSPAGNAVLERYGIGAPVQRTHDQAGNPHLEIDWGTLLLNLALTYLASVLLAGLASGNLRWKRPLLTYGLAALSMLALSFALSVRFSHHYWGYWFHPPGPLPKMRLIETVHVFLPLEVTETTEHSPGLFKAEEPVYEIEELASLGSSNREYPVGNLHAGLKAIGKLPKEYSAELPDDLPCLISSLEGSGLIIPASYGPRRWFHSWESYLLTATGRQGERLIFLLLVGHNFSNDHYAVYEAVFQASPGKDDWRYVTGQRYFFDMAGLEGFTWYVVWMLTAPFMLVGGITTLAALTGLARVLPPKWPKPRSAPTSPR
ncbi:MAG: hypothetical protein AAGK14_15395 [Verrucomicrobiota bacterium]